jgi:hypothetical protein
MKKKKFVRRSMAARRAVRSAKACSDRDAEVTAHHVVDEAKRALGERGAAWWDDGAPDLNRRMVKNTLYANCTRGWRIDEPCSAEGELHAESRYF